MTYGKNKFRNILIGLTVFVIGCLITAAPFFIRAQLIHADETDRHEQTMAAGITMFMGLSAAPFGGTITVFLWRWFRRRAKGSRGEFRRPSHWLP